MMPPQKANKSSRARARRATLYALGLLLAILVAPLPAFSQTARDWPIKPVRVEVAFPAGGTVDTLTRLIVARLAVQLGRSVVVENMSGGTGIIATGAVARAAGDGYTLLMGNLSGLVTNRFLHKRLEYDPDAFELIAVAAYFPLVLMANPSTPGKTLAELVAYAKANPGKLTYASYGIGSAAHFQMEMLKQAAGVDLLHIPFRGASDAPPAVISGEVSLYFAPATTAINHYKGGKGV